MRFCLLLFACSSSSPIVDGLVRIDLLPGSATFNAAFTERVASENHCLHVDGSCQARDAACVQDAPKPVFHSAGTLTISGPRSLDTIAPDVGKQYPQIEPQAYLPGDTVAVAAAGASVPAFEGNVVVPMPLQIADLPASIPRDQDLTVSWSGGAAGEKVSLVIYSTTPSTIQIDCAFDATAESGQVPSTLLSLVPAGAEGHWMGKQVFAEATPAPSITLRASLYLEGFANLSFN